MNGMLYLVLLSLSSSVRFLFFDLLSGSPLSCAYYGCMTMYSLSLFSIRLTEVSIIHFFHSTLSLILFFMLRMSEQKLVQNHRKKNAVSKVVMNKRKTEIWVMILLCTVKNMSLDFCFFSIIIRFPVKCRKKKNFTDIFWHGIDNEVSKYIQGFKGSYQILPIHQFILIIRDNHIIFYYWLWNHTIFGQKRRKEWKASVCNSIISTCWRIG